MENVAFLLVVLVVAAAGWLLWRTYRSKQTPAARHPGDVLGEQHKAEIDQLKQMQNGDIVLYQGEQWFVRGRIELDEGGFTWIEHLLDEGAQRRWLSLEEDEEFEVTLWTSIPAGEIEAGEAGDRTVAARGLAFTLQEKGQATFRASGATGTTPTGQMRYADYRASDGTLLGFENFGGSWEASIGEKLIPWELTILPSTDRKGSL